MAKRLVLIPLIVMFISDGCVSINSVNSDYHTALQESSAKGENEKRTVVLFLIDGLSLSTLTEMTQAHRLPQIEKFFLTGRGKINQGHTIFPSLTYPSIATLLTGLPVDEHHVLGNKTSLNGTDLDFESPMEKDALNNLLDGKTVFSKLKGRHQTSVSFDYSFTAGATASLPGADLEAGINVIKQNYEEIDDKIIDSLYTLLHDTPNGEWPSFIFVHLVGVDFTSHDFGPRAPEVRGYMEQLDSKLKKAFKVLKRYEDDRNIVTVLTSDHGFDRKITKVLDIETGLREIDENIRVINEGRFVTLYFPRTWTKERKNIFLKKLVTNPDIALTATRDKDQISVFTSNQDLTIGLKEEKSSTCSSPFLVKIGASLKPNVKGYEDYVCPEKFEEKDAPVYLYPYFVTNFSHYFHASNHPDAIIIPLSGVAFDDRYEGHHGGLTPEEVLIPILIRNAILGDPKKILPSNRLLNLF